MNENFMDFSDKAEKAFGKGKVLKFPIYRKNLRYDSDGVYSYCTKIAELSMGKRTIQKLGYYSPTSSRHYNYSKNLLETNYHFREIEDSNIYMSTFDSDMHT
jgi:hypothetical protein